MARVRIIHVDARGLEPYVAGLRRLERDIVYPLADGRDSFRIDHGDAYHEFFSNLGEAHFLIALAGDEVIGTVAGILRDARVRSGVVPTAYVADFKVAHAHRGTAVARNMLFVGLLEMLKTKRYRQWRFVYGAAMRGARGDVMKSARGIHPARLLRPHARLSVFFVEPRKLAAIDPSQCPSLSNLNGIDLSPHARSVAEGPGIVSTRGRKDLVLGSTGEPWPLQHLVLGPTEWRPTLGAYLVEAGRFLVSTNKDGLACFALDSRLLETIAWLSRIGIIEGAACTVHGLRFPPTPRNASWIHLATSDI